ncbi:BatD family protein [Labrenzia sp. PHM005]|uniref:BatD family protein n=1 Tax=Labrenzia sp. PHM005 TaxID=2590016 RepID=UPI001140688D|nr:BatD family protein [Labrenzia sp. PHM005]QDG78740.1 protein BatD [Labrenzia sp. PHM005]
MIRAIFALCLLLFSAAVQAQETPQPIVRTTLEQDTAIPGQPLIFRVTILVPTWMPTPPVFPSFEAQNVVVRLPSRASSPTSERVNGDTWSGVSRAYRLYPMVPGTFHVPGGPVTITYADPDTRQPIKAEVDVAPFAITGEAPDSAKELTPFLAANALTLTRQVGGTPEDLAAGDALKVTTTIKVTGVAPMFVPPMGAGDPVEGLSYYPTSPGLKETDNRGELSGSRTETVTIIAENTGTYQIPEQKLFWYNLTSDKVETASVPAIDLTVTGPPVAAEPQSEALNWRSIAYWGAATLLLMGLLAWLLRKFGPKAVTMFHEAKVKYEATEYFAYRHFKKAINTQDYSATMAKALDWKNRLDAVGARPDWTPLEHAFTTLGMALYGSKSPASNTEIRNAWTQIQTSAADVRHQAKTHIRRRSKTPLPPLNPVDATKS